MGLLAWWLRGNPAVARFPPIVWMIVAAIASVAGTFGDLLESKLKRMAGVKDSGRIMPGHGGFLDRFELAVDRDPLRVGLPGMDRRRGVVKNSYLYGFNSSEK